MVTDLSFKKSDHVNADPSHADNCPYCKKNAAEELASLAIIEVIDAEGNTPSKGAQQLLGLAEGEIIVAQGTAQLDSLGTLVVRTKGIFIRSN